MRITPEALENEFSLNTAVSRLDFLSRRDDGDASLDPVQAIHADDWSSIRNMGTSLDVAEALELLALGELVARKAHDSRLTGIRAALRGGAGWEEIAAALGVPPGEAWEIFARAIDEQVGDHALSADAAQAARDLAGTRP
jgi:hypothetical protein